MRCTKCHYLSFEPEPRCRHCGHDLSIDEMDEIQRRDDNESDALGDFQLDLGRQTQEVGGHSDRNGGVAVLERPAVAAVSKAPVVPVAPMTTELPLFVSESASEDVDEEPDLTPLVSVPASPRPPLAVRRPTPDPVKLRARYSSASREPDLLDVVEDVSHEPLTPTPFHDVPSRYPTEEQPAAAYAVSEFAPVPLGARFGAAAIDVTVLVAIAATVVVLTAHLAGLTLGQATVLPLIPMLVFFALIGMGYELMFTAANGQTIGKMAMGLKVVSDEPSVQPVSWRQAFTRTVAMLPLGVGLVAALGGAGLAVHDRVAHTRVVRV